MGLVSLGFHVSVGGSCDILPQAQWLQAATYLSVSWDGIGVWGCRENPLSCRPSSGGTASSASGSSGAQWPVLTAVPPALTLSRPFPPPPLSPHIAPGRDRKLQKLGPEILNFCVCSSAPYGGWDREGWLSPCVPQLVTSGGQSVLRRFCELQPAPSLRLSPWHRREGSAWSSPPPHLRISTAARGSGLARASHLHRSQESLCRLLFL